eukprot:gene20429-22442_t
MIQQAILLICCSSMILAVCSSIRNDSPFGGYYGFDPFHKLKPKMLRISPDRSIAQADIRNSKFLGPNVCVKRHPIGRLRQCIRVNDKYNCTIAFCYRSVFHCCPGFQTSTGKSGCPKELYTSSKNVFEVVKSLKLTTFATFLMMSGLNAIISNSNATEKFTVFAPNEDAFALLGREKMRQYIDNSKELTDLLLDHITSGKTPVSGFENNQMLSTLRGGKIRFNCYYRRKLKTINGVRIVDENVAASNGIVHVVNFIITSPKYRAVDVLQRNENTTFFRRLLKLSKIKITGRETIFAPTNEAFNRLDSAFLDRVLKMPEYLKNLVLNHILPDVVYTEVVKGENDLFGVRTKEGTAYYMKLLNRKIRIGSASIVKPDVTAQDAVIHVIDNVLVPTSAKTILDVAKQKGASVFTKLIEEIGLQSLLSQSNETFTIFAPSDEAWQQFIKSSTENVLANISDIVQYHIVPRCSLQACDFVNDMQLNTLAGDKKIRVNVYNNGRVNSVQGVCIKNTRCSPEAGNGAVHIIPRPLVAPTRDLKTLIESDSRFTTFARALKNTGLFSMFSFKSKQKQQSLTIFAPSNAAFSKISSMKTLLADKAQLCDLIKNHIVRGTLFSCALNGVSRVSSINGCSLLLKTSPKTGVLNINLKFSSQKQIVATNGLLYPIDEVLLQPPRRHARFFQRPQRTYAMP